MFGHPLLDHPLRVHMKAIPSQYSITHHPILPPLFFVGNRKLTLFCEDIKESDLKGFPGEFVTEMKNAETRILIRYNIENLD